MTNKRCKICGQDMLTLNNKMCKNYHLQNDSDNISKDNEYFKISIIKYKHICALSAPYPLNYLTQMPENTGLAILIGILIEKELL
jgi:hypothetical protein